MKQFRVEDWVYEEWEQFAFGDYKGLSLDEQSRLWQALYNKTYLDGQWTVGLGSAAMLTGSGWYIAVMKGEFGHALEIAMAFFSHTDITPEVRVHGEYLQIRVKQGVSEVLSGDTLGGCDRLSKLLKADIKSRSVVRLSIRCMVRNMIEEMDQTSPPHPRIAELVREILLSYRGKKRIAASVSQANTYAKLLELLRTAFHSS